MLSSNNNMKHLPSKYVLNLEYRPILQIKKWVGLLPATKSLKRDNILHITFLYCSKAEI